MLGNFSSKLLVFLMVPLYTSVLSTAEYATSDLLTTTINLLYPFATLMISTAVMRFCLDKCNNTRQLLSIGFWIEMVGILLVTVGSFFFFNTGNLQGYRLYFLAGFAGYSFYTLLMEYAKGCEKVTMYSLAGVCNTIALILCNIFFLLKLGSCRPMEQYIANPRGVYTLAFGYLENGILMRPRLPRPIICFIS